METILINWQHVSSQLNLEAPVATKRPQDLKIALLVIHKSCTCVHYVYCRYKKGYSI